MKIRTYQILTLFLILFSSCEDSENSIAVIKANGKYGYINSVGDLVIDTIFDYAATFEDGLAPAGINGKQGFIDYNGEFVIEPIFDEVSWYYEGLAEVMKDDKYGFINKQGELIIPYSFEETDWFSSGLCAVTIKTSTGEYRCGYINKHGNWAIEPIFDYCTDFKDSIAMVGAHGDSTVFFINKNGAKVDCDISFDNFTNPGYENHIEHDKKFGLLNSKGDTILKPIYEAIGVEQENRIIVRKDRLWGVVDSYGKWIVKPIFDDINHYYEGLASVKIKGKWGFVDKNGEIEIKPKYDYVGKFSCGLARVELKGKQGYIDKKGMVRVDFIYDIMKLGSDFEHIGKLITAGNKSYRE